MDFALIDDDETEDEEMFYVFLTVGSTSVTLGSNTSATVTIIDNDRESTSLQYCSITTQINKGHICLPIFPLSYSRTSLHHILLFRFFLILHFIILF